MENSLCKNPLYESPRFNDIAMEELIPKKVQFREEVDSPSDEGPQVSMVDLKV